MKRLLLPVVLLFSAVSSQAQIVSDNLDWVSPTAVFSATSPAFNLCEGQVTYTITSTIGFKSVSTSGNPALTNGMITPGYIYDPTLSIPITITFSEPVCRLKIRFDDLDGAQNEKISSISPAYSSLTDAIGNFYDPGAAGNEVNADIDNARGWVEWMTPVTTLSFNYIRPYEGCGLVIDSMVFQCCSLDVGDPEDAATVAVYPNPVTDELSVSAQGLQAASLYTIAGEQVFSARANGSDTMKIAFGELAAGVYVVVAETSSGIHYRKIVK